MTNPHTSVMPLELLEGLKIKDGGVYIDATFGAGGHSRKILESSKNTKIIAIDRDPSAITRALEIENIFGKDRFVFKNALFSEIADVYRGEVDGIMYDIGVSSMQIDQADRGFSFSRPGPLSMTMGINDVSASDIINNTPQDELANIIYNYGEERRSRAIARKIVEHRSKQPITDTMELAEIVRSAIGKTNEKIHPATRTFQAIRIATNNELEELSRSLKSGIKILKSQGRMCVITFHSLEDRIVKNIFNQYSNKPVAEFDRNYGTASSITQTTPKTPECIKVITKKPIIPCEAEIKNNPRSRSAKLRVAEKL